MFSLKNCSCRQKLCRSRCRNGNTSTRWTPAVFQASECRHSPRWSDTLPAAVKRVDYEGELALVIGEHCTNCTPEQAHSKIWGNTIANDVTARDLQKRDNQWARAKGFDTFCPLGPWIVRELSPAAQLQTFINGSDRPVQSSQIDRMVFSPAFLVSYISHIMTLLPGDVILTGTPQGVGPMQIGDRVRIEIEGIGSLENTVIQ